MEHETTVIGGYETQFLSSKESLPESPGQLNIVFSIAK